MQKILKSLYLSFLIAESQKYHEIRKVSLRSLKAFPYLSFYYPKNTWLIYERFLGNMYFFRWYPITVRNFPVRFHEKTLVSGRFLAWICVSSGESFSEGNFPDFSCFCVWWNSTQNTTSIFQLFFFWQHSAGSTQEIWRKTPEKNAISSWNPVGSGDRNHWSGNWFLLYHLFALSNKYWPYSGILLVS